MNRLLAKRSYRRELLLDERFFILIPVDTPIQTRMDNFFQDFQGNNVSIILTPHRANFL